jgi:hypothetical protein
MACRSARGVGCVCKREWRVRCSTPSVLHCIALVVVHCRGMRWPCIIGPCAAVCPTASAQFACSSSVGRAVCLHQQQHVGMVALLHAAVLQVVCCCLLTCMALPAAYCPPPCAPQPPPLQTPYTGPFSRLSAVLHLPSTQHGARSSALCNLHRLAARPLSCSCCWCLCTATEEQHARKSSSSCCCCGSRRNCRL